MSGEIDLSRLDRVLSQYGLSKRQWNERVKLAHQQLVERGAELAVFDE